MFGVGPIAVVMHEPHATAGFLIVLGVLMGFSVLASRAVDRLGVPIVLLFLILGMLGGSEGYGGVAFENYALAVRIGTIALVLILFDGGLNTSAASVRRVFWPTITLGTLGVAITAAAIGAAARLLGMDWPMALLLGAVVSSTDAAAVFALLRGGRMRLNHRVGPLIEVESCVNDPTAVILTTTLIQFAAHEHVAIWHAIIDVPAQLVIGAGVGIGFGFVSIYLARRFRLPTVGLYPALTLSVALASFGVATVAQGSGFLAVYVTAIMLGNADLPYRNGLIRVHDALAWLAQIGAFLMLGLLVFPSQLPEVAGIGLLLGLILAFVARPLAAVCCLAPFRYSTKEIAYVGWVGLRGAVPIVLATFPVLANVPGAQKLFNIVFFIVVVNALIPGATIRAVTRWMKMGVIERPGPTAMIEINSSKSLRGILTPFRIEPTVAVCDALLSEIDFPPGSSVVLISRSDDLIPARGKTKLLAGDFAYVFYDEQDRPLIELLFGKPDEA